MLFFDSIKLSNKCKDLSTNDLLTQLSFSTNELLDVFKKINLEHKKNPPLVRAEFSYYRLGLSDLAIHDVS